MYGIKYVELSTQLGQTSPYLFYGRWLAVAAVVSLFFNYVNLLPVFPLDGGRVVERPPRALEVLLGGSVYLLCLALPFLYATHMLRYCKYEFHSP